MNTSRIQRSPNLTDQVTQALRLDIVANARGAGAALPSEHSAHDKRRESQAHEEHAAVYQAIRTKNAERARVAARVLLENTSTLIVAEPEAAKGN